jgi:hypothetical protein
VRGSIRVIKDILLSERDSGIGIRVKAVRLVFKEARASKAVKWYTRKCDFKQSS